MTARKLDGNEIARIIRTELRAEVAALAGPHRPCLGVILVGDDAPSHVYVRNKERACEEVGIDTIEHRLPASSSETDVISMVRRLNHDERVNGILVQLPLPAHINKLHVFDTICPTKDVDVFTPYNTGLLVQNRPTLRPCTPQAVVEILRRSDIPIKGQRVAIVNRSLVVGQPLAAMLVQNHEFANATVTVCHEHTPNMGGILRDADIVVTAVGNRSAFILSADMVKPGATVIDVAIIRNGGRLMGDADESVWRVAGAMTPVPGGVGPCTIAMLLRNTLTAFYNQRLAD
jgi:methylenetetrahydrofolate dehydrogenase (NADP+)/methenyltetrahydrofolate cyclohydrolase